MSLTYGFCLGPEDTQYNSAQFSDAFHALFGDGITPYGAKFSITLGGFTARVASGYALASGRWVENDEPYLLSVPLPNRNGDRTDALVCRADYTNRKASLEVLVDVDEAAIRENPSILRTDEEYSCVLYFVKVRRGATSLATTDITDVRADGSLCGYITPLAEISKSVLYIYRFLTSGIDEQVARLISMSDDLIAKADAEIKSLDKHITDTGLGYAVGDLMTTRRAPASDKWLLCDGSTVPAEYPELSEMLGGTLPNIESIDGRYDTYIYGGDPVRQPPKTVTVLVDTTYLTYGALTVAGMRITESSTTFETTERAVTVSFTANSQLENMLAVSVDGDDIGHVYNADDSVSTTIHVADGMTITVSFAEIEAVVAVIDAGIIGIDIVGTEVI